MDMGEPIQEARGGGKAGPTGRLSGARDPPYVLRTGWRSTVFSFSGALLRGSPR